MQILKFMKIVKHKHNLMILSSIGSVHPGKYSYEIPHEYSSGWRNLSGKTISMKRNPQSNLVSFLQIAIFLLADVATFSVNIDFGRSCFFTLFRSNYFDTTVTFSEQLFLQNSCFFLFFQNSHFVAPVGNYMFKVNNRNTRTRCEICSKLTIKTPERPQ